MKIKTNFFTEEELDSLLEDEKNLNPSLKGALEKQMESIKTPSISTPTRSIHLLAATQAGEFYGEDSTECTEMYTYGRILSGKEREKIRIRGKILEILKKI